VLALGGSFLVANIIHDSDCSVNNAPALPVGPCDCGAAEKSTVEFARKSAFLDRVIIVSLVVIALSALATVAQFALFGMPR
jgi:hypothetical protein